MRNLLGKTMAAALAAAAALSIAACGSTPKAAALRDGSYVAEAAGNNGPVKIKTTIEGGRIASIEVVSHAETPGLSDPAFERIPEAIVKGQTLAVDAVSGATHVSEAILEAVEKGLKEAGADIQALKVKKETAEAAAETLDCDVVVVGAGGSGATAAVTVAESGKKVIVLEKAGNPGGTSIIASGIYASDSKKQAEAGIVCRTSDVYEWWQNYVSWLNDSNLTWKFFKKSASTIEWLEERGFEFKIVPNVQKVHADSFETYHAFLDDGKRLQYMKTLLSGVEKNGGQILYETRAEKILMKDGRAVGVVAKAADGTMLTVNAKAVVVATGGFGANPDIVAEVSGGVKMSSLNSGTQTGDGQKMAREAGAGGADQRYIHYHGVDMPFEIIGAAATSGDGSKGATGGIDSVNHLANYPGGLWVNKKGSRFISESLCYDSALVANATYRAGGDYYVVIDAKSLKALEAKGSSGLGINNSPERLAGFPLAPVNQPWTGLASQFETAIKLRGGFKADSIAGLAKAMGMEPAVLEKTVAAYNAVCAAKSDEQFGKEAQYLIPVSEGPYYAALGRTVQLGGLGGISTDDRLNATTPAGKAIPGLYAAGSDVNGIYNNVYPLIEGVTAGWAYNSGRIAGESVVEDLN